MVIAVKCLLILASIVAAAKNEKKVPAKNGNTEPASQDSTSQHNENRVSEATPHPWIMSLRTGPKKEHYCSGVWIGTGRGSAKIDMAYFLTAAHCIEKVHKKWWQFLTPKENKVVTAVSGARYTDKDGEESTTVLREYRLESFKYEETKTKADIMHDIAMQSGLPFSDKYGDAGPKLKMAPVRSFLPIGLEVITFGWGDEGAHLKQAKVLVRNTTECVESWKNEGVTIDGDSVFCVDEVVPGSVKHSGGAPLVLEENGTFYLYGIASIPSQGDLPAVYTSVPTFGVMIADIVFNGLKAWKVNDTRTQQIREEAAEFGKRALDFTPKLTPQFTSHSARRQKRGFITLLILIVLIVGGLCMLFIPGGQVGLAAVGLTAAIAAGTSAQAALMIAGIVSLCLGALIGIGVAIGAAASAEMM